jgi:hypothetical protein
MLILGAHRIAVEADIFLRDEFLHELGRCNQLHNLLCQ